VVTVCNTYNEQLRLLGSAFGILQVYNISLTIHIFCIQRRILVETRRKSIVLLVYDPLWVSWRILMNNETRTNMIFKERRRILHGKLGMTRFW
jgi:hypothetical protein